MSIRRGDVYYADLRPVVGCEQGGIRPVLIIQNDMGNAYSPTVICAAISARMNKKWLPTHVPVDEPQILKPSVILLEQIRTIDKSRLKECLGQISDEAQHEVDCAIRLSLGV